MLGGEANDWHALGTVEVYTPSSQSWSIAPDMLSVRSFVAAVEHDGFGYCF